MVKVALFVVYSRRNRPQNASNTRIFIRVMFYSFRNLVSNVHQLHRHTLYVSECGWLWVEQSVIIKIDKCEIAYYIWTFSLVNRQNNKIYSIFAVLFRNNNIYLLYDSRSSSFMIVQCLRRLCDVHFVQKRTNVIQPHTLPTLSNANGSRHVRSSVHFQSRILDSGDSNRFC